VLSVRPARTSMAGVYPRRRSLSAPGHLRRSSTGALLTGVGLGGFAVGSDDGAQGCPDAGGPSTASSPLYRVCFHTATSAFIETNYGGARLYFGHFRPGGGRG